MNAPIDITNVTLTTPRLTLRPWRQEDLLDFYAYAKVDGVGQRAGWAPHKDLAESQTILNLFIQGKRTFAIEYQGKAIGSIGIEEYKEACHPDLADLKGRELGYALSKDYWGQGLMPEAVQAVIRYLFGTVGLDFLLVYHFVWNDRSRRVIEKCGFRYIKDVSYETRLGKIEPSKGYILHNPERS